MRRLTSVSAHEPCAGDKYTMTSWLNIPSCIRAKGLRKRVKLDVTGSSQG
ncbi:hypothetical protein K0I63_03085 [Shewanella rhizosphaerae]|nr:hypothetical protein [Shewanella rhizosphaerae]QYK13517.1 hypothetical protein K0I63_03085 [Shewanella rhizosphaerae]